MTLESGANNATYVRDPDGLLLSIASGGSVGNYARDRLGSITGLTDSVGNLTYSYRYDPWGGSLAASGSSGKPFRFIGAYLDSSSSLYLMGQRYYESRSGRFSQLDPHPKQLLSINRYAYSGCNPINYTGSHGSPRVERPCLPGGA